MITKNLPTLLALGCIGAFAATNYDLLGRKGSQMNSPMVYKDVDYKLVNKNSFEHTLLERQGLQNVDAIEGSFDPDEILESPHSSYKTQYAVYSGSRVSKFVRNAYPTSSSKNFSPISNYFTPIYFNRTQSPNKTVASTYTQYAPTTPYPKAESRFNVKSPYSNNTISYVLAGYYQGDFDNQDEQIGVYIAGDAEPAKMSSTDKTKYTSLSGTCSKKPMPGHEYQVSLQLAALNNLTKNVAPFIIDVNCGVKFPTAPENKYPQILIGLHTRKDANGTNNDSSTDSYNSYAQNLDNHIYENHTVEIVGAGNFGAKPKDANADWTGSLTAEAHAANAITVGSVDKNFAIERTSSWKNPVYNGQKPEIYAQTNYYLPDLPGKKYSSFAQMNPFLNGTRGASVLTTAAVVDLLREEPFLRWHPEIVKARLLTASFLKNTGSILDRDVLDKGKEHILNINALYHYHPAGLDIYTNYSRFWNGDFKKFATKDDDNAQEIRFTVNIQKGLKYRAAIAWLSSGDDIAKYKKIPQDLNLYAYWSNNASLDSDNKTDNAFDYQEFKPNPFNKDNLIASSTSSSNPFELIEFTAKKGNYVTFVIKLNNDISTKYNGKVKLGFNLLKIDE